MGRQLSDAELEVLVARLGDDEEPEALARRIARELSTAGLGERNPRSLANTIRKAREGDHAGVTDFLERREAAQGAPDGPTTPVTGLDGPGEGVDLESAQGDALTVDVDPVDLEGEQVRPCLTITVADMQFGEAAFLLNCWEDVKAQAADRVRAVQPGRLVVVVNGDAVTGGGVFRDQELVVQLPSTDPQVLYCAVKLRRLLDALIEAGPEDMTVEVILVPGNHDKTKGREDAMLHLVFALRLLDVPAKYHGRPCIVDLSPPDAAPFFVWYDHGHGGSDYYANSYSQIRGVWRFLVEQADFRANADRIRRVSVGHTHWLQIGYHVAGEVLMDTAGGWTRQERITLGIAQRRVGALCYVHNGATFTPSSITPRRDVFRGDVDSSFLGEDNAEDQVQALRWFKAHLIDLGVLSGRTGRA